MVAFALPLVVELLQAGGKAGKIVADGFVYLPDN